MHFYISKENFFLFKTLLSKVFFFPFKAFSFKKLVSFLNFPLSKNPFGFEVFPRPFSFLFHNLFSTTSHLLPSHFVFTLHFYKPTIFFVFTYYQHNSPLLLFHSF